MSEQIPSKGGSCQDRLWLLFKLGWLPFLAREILRDLCWIAGQKIHIISEKSFKERKHLCCFLGSVLGLPERWRSRVG